MMTYEFTNPLNQFGLQTRTLLIYRNGDLIYREIVDYPESHTQDDMNTHAEFVITLLNSNQGLENG